MSESHAGKFNGAYHLGTRKSCPICDHFTGRAARLTLAAVVTLALVVALIRYAAGSPLSLPQFVAVMLLPWAVGIADRQGWLWYGRDWS